MYVQFVFVSSRPHQKRMNSFLQRVGYQAVFYIILNLHVLSILCVLWAFKIMILKMNTTPYQLFLFHIRSLSLSLLLSILLFHPLSLFIFFFLSPSSLSLSLSLSVSHSFCLILSLSLSLCLHCLSLFYLSLSHLLSFSFTLSLSFVSLYSLYSFFSLIQHLCRDLSQRVSGWCARERRRNPHQIHTKRSECSSESLIDAAWFECTFFGRYKSCQPR